MASAEEDAMIREASKDVIIKVHRRMMEKKKMALAVDNTKCVRVLFSSEDVPQIHQHHNVPQGHNLSDFFTDFEKRISDALPGGLPRPRPGTMILTFEGGLLLKKDTPLTLDLHDGDELTVVTCDDYPSRLLTFIGQELQSGPTERGELALDELREIVAFWDVNFKYERERSERKYAAARRRSWARSSRAVGGRPPEPPPAAGEGVGARRERGRGDAEGERNCEGGEVAGANASVCGASCRRGWGGPLLPLLVCGRSGQARGLEGARAKRARRRRRCCCCCSSAAEAGKRDGCRGETPRP
jgi:hypothetical protein